MNKNKLKNFSREIKKKRKYDEYFVFESLFKTKSNGDANYSECSFVFSVCSNKKSL